MSNLAYKPPVNFNRLYAHLTYSTTAHHGTHVLWEMTILGAWSMTLLHTLTTYT